MEIKVDTKEKFTVLRPDTESFSVTMAASLTTIVRGLLQTPVKNVIVDFSRIQRAEKQALIDLAALQSEVYNHPASFVVCNVQPNITKPPETPDLPDVLNITPTESEAWDIVQMEEIERELFDN